MRTNTYKANLERIAEGYEEARDIEFDIQFRDMFNEYFLTEKGMKIVITEDDLQGFIDSFNFEEEFEWCASEYESQRDSYEDAKYEQMRDERCR